ncbi:hypothetical protein DFS34DRAFT_343053 [Phlyctochytrium arcticum]|nr:hypothetical protein DFS34DRAFT_343053 [Phlyctochytrium arcticum]
MARRWFWGEGFWARKGEYVTVAPFYTLRAIYTFVPLTFFLIDIIYFSPVGFEPQVFTLLVLYPRCGWTAILSNMDLFFSPVAASLLHLSSIRYLNENSCSNGPIVGKVVSEKQESQSRRYNHTPSRHSVWSPTAAPISP